jgi:LDH2 family malate/lactate/ureidoglycolate dehydrogenase
MIGLATSNGTPARAPWGGRMPFFGANPLAIAVPAGVEAPVVFDMAPSVVARAHIRQACSPG